MSARTKLIFEGDNRTTRAFNDIQRNLGTLQGRLRPLSAGITTLTRNLRSAAGALGLIAAGAGFARLGSDVIRFNDQVAKMARALGEPVEQVSALAFAFELAGTNAAGTERVLARISAASDEAAAGNKRLADTFGNLSIDLVAFGQLDLVAQVGALAEALSELPEGDRVFSAQQLVGLRNATDLLNLAANGADGVARGIRDAQLSGAVITAEQAADAENLADALGRLNARTRQIAAEKVVGPLAALVGPAAVATENVDELAQALRLAREEVALLKSEGPGIAVPVISPAVEIKPPPPEQILEAQSSISQLLTAGFEEGAQGVDEVFNRLLQRLFTELAASQFLQLLRTLIPGLTGGEGVLGSIGSILGFQRGTERVPGPTGAPQLAVVHGGEQILPSNGAARGGAGGTTINVDARGAGPNVGAIVREAVLEATALSTRQVIDLERRGRFR